VTRERDGEFLQPFSEIAPQVCEGLAWFCTDIDDTMTTDGMLPAASYEALWRLHHAGVAVVPITGRPAGWCDHIARFWPVAAVVGENGAFYFSYDRKARKMKREYLSSRAEREEGAARMKRLRARVLSEVPGAAIAADQPYRLTDLAIDFREDVAPLGPAAVRKICAIAEEEGLTYKVSSIHINCWFGSHSKVKCLNKYLEDSAGGNLAAVQERLLFIGDSPNDEPIFAEIRNSVGVANIRAFEGELTHPPRFVTNAKNGDGFCEAVDLILRYRAK